MGTLLRSCAKVCEPIELMFGVVSGVGFGICVLHEVQVPQGKEQFPGIFAPIGLNGVFFAQRCI